MSGTILWRALLGAAVLSVGWSATPLHAQTTWNIAGGGDWATAGNWSAGIPSASVDAIIGAGAPSSASTITITSAAAAQNLTLNNSNASLSLSSTFSLSGTATLTSGVFQLNGGSINGGTWNSAGAKIRPITFLNTITGATLGAGVLDLTQGGGVQLAGGTALPTGTFVIGNNTTSPTARLGYNQTVAVTSTTFQLSNNSSLSVEGAGNTLTIGSTSSVSFLGSGSGSASFTSNNFAGSSGSLANSGTIGFDPTSTGTLTLQVTPFNGSFTNLSGGIVQANATASGSATLNLGGFNNTVVNNGGATGIMKADGASTTLNVTPGFTFTNGAGSTLLATNGGTVTINPGGTAPNWSNAGTIQVNGASSVLNLGGSFTTAGLGTLSRTSGGGTVNITGSWNNASSVIDLSTLGTLNLSGAGFVNAVITGGSITQGASSNVLRPTSTAANLLNNVAIGAGVLDMTGSAGGQMVRLQNGTSLPTGTFVIGNNTSNPFVRLGYEQTTTVNNTTFSLRNNSSLSVEGSSGFTLTLGSTSAVSYLGTGSNNAHITNSVISSGASHLANSGVIQFDTSSTGSPILFIDPLTGSFTNNVGGLVQANVSGGTVRIAPAFSNTFTNNGALRALNGGVVDVPSSTFNFANFSGGTLTGGAYEVFANSSITMGSRLVTTLGTGTNVVLSGTGSSFDAVDSVLTTINSGASLAVLGSRVFTPGGSGLAVSGTLSGTGTINSAATVTINNGGTIRPGASPGILSTGSEVWNVGGNYNWQIHDTDALAPGSLAWSRVAITGTLDLSALDAFSDFDFNLWSLSLVSPDSNGDAIDWDPSVAHTWAGVVTTTGGIIDAANVANIEVFVTPNNGAGGFSNSLNGGTFSLVVVGNQINLVFTPTPVPEPGSFLLCGVVALCGAYGWRRRQRLRAAGTLRTDGEASPSA